MFWNKGPEVRRRFRYGIVPRNNPTRRLPRAGKGYCDNGMLHCVIAMPKWQRYGTSLFQTIADQGNYARVRPVEDLMPRVSDLSVDLVTGSQTGVPISTRVEHRKPLAEQLKAKLATDMKMGFTGIGPQRAELAMFSDGMPGGKDLSRASKKCCCWQFNLSYRWVSEKDSRCPCFWSMTWRQSWTKKSTQRRSVIDRTQRRHFDQDR